MLISELHSYVIQCDVCGYVYMYSFPHMLTPADREFIANTPGWEFCSGKFICQKCAVQIDETSNDASKSEDADEYDESYDDDDD